MSQDRVILEFSGWAVLDPDTKMEFVGAYEDGVSAEQIITAEKWLKLPEEQRDQYELCSFGEAFHSCQEYELDAVRAVADEYIKDGATTDD